MQNNHKSIEDTFQAFTVILKNLQNLETSGENQDLTTSQKDQSKCSIDIAQLKELLSISEILESDVTRVRNQNEYRKDIISQLEEELDQSQMKIEELSIQIASSSQNNQNTNFGAYRVLGHRNSILSDSTGDKSNKTKLFEEQINSLKSKLRYKDEQIELLTLELYELRPKSPTSRKSQLFSTTSQKQSRHSYGLAKKVESQDKKKVRKNSIEIENERLKGIIQNIQSQIDSKASPNEGTRLFLHIPKPSSGRGKSPSQNSKGFHGSNKSGNQKLESMGADSWMDDSENLSIIASSIGSATNQNKKNKYDQRRQFKSILPDIDDIIIEQDAEDYQSPVKLQQRAQHRRSSVGTKRPPKRFMEMNFQLERQQSSEPRSFNTVAKKQNGDFYTPDKGVKTRKSVEGSPNKSRKVSTKFGDFSYISEEKSELDLSKSILDILPNVNTGIVEHSKVEQINFTLDGNKRKKKRKKKKKSTNGREDEYFVKKSGFQADKDNSKQNDAESEPKYKKKKKRKRGKKKKYQTEEPSKANSNEYEKKK